MNVKMMLGDIMLEWHTVAGELLTSPLQELRESREHTFILKGLADPFIKV